MFFHIWLTMQMIGLVISPFAVRYALDLISDDFTIFLKTTKSFPFAFSDYEFYGGPDHPEGWFDWDEIYNYYDENFDIDVFKEKNVRHDINKMLKLYRFLGIIKRKCYHNHDIYRVR